MKLRVLQVLPCLNPGGAERVSVSIACGLDRERYEPGVVALSDAITTQLAERLQSADLPSFEFRKREGFDPRMYGQLRRMVRTFRPHILHTHLHVLHYTALPAWAENVPVQVHTVHSIAQKEATGIRRWFQSVVFRRNVVPVAVAAAVASTLRDVYGIAAEVIANGIEVEKYRTPSVCREILRAAAGFAEDDIVFLCTASLRPAKGHQALLQAFEMAFGWNPRARLVLAGDGALRPLLERKASLLGVQQQVCFLGDRRDIPDLLAASDVFVLASSWEGNPLAVMEAMAAGKPVIATAVGGLPELVENGRHGLLLEPGDIPALAGAMRYLFELPDRRRDMGNAGARRALRDFDVGVMVHAYEQLYESLMAKTKWAPLFQSQTT